MENFDIKREKRKKVPGFGGKYEVGDLGYVYSKGAVLTKVRGMYVSLSGKEEGVRQMRVSYLVARAFVPNAEMRPYVVHINGDIRDDRAVNLMWSEQREVKRGRMPRKEPVVVEDMKTLEFMGRFESVIDACRAFGFGESHARKVLRGEVKSIKGYFLRYEGV